MGLTMHERHALVREQSSRFRQLGKKERSEMLDHFVQMTGYTRCYAAFVLRTCGRRYVRMLKGKRVVFIPGHARNPGTKRLSLFKSPSRPNAIMIHPTGELCHKLR